MSSMGPSAQPATCIWLVVRGPNMQFSQETLMPMEYATIRMNSYGEMIYGNLPLGISLCPG